MQKRGKLRRPLLRRFWPVTSTDDTNPHLVFRTREKEKYKLRKKRQNDMEAFRKLKQLREDFDNLRAVLGLVCRREELLRMHVNLRIDLFRQRLYDTIDTSGLPSGSTGIKTLSNESSLSQLLDLPVHFELFHGRRKPRRIRYDSDISSLSPLVNEAGCRAVNTLPTSHLENLQQQHNSFPLSGTLSDRVGSAGVLGTNLAPHFAQPLESRDISYRTTWEGKVPHFFALVDSHPTPTFRFRNRPRAGRGGRILIDRFPLPVLSESVAPVTVLTAGQPLPVSSNLMDLVGRPLNHSALTAKLDELSVASLRQDAALQATDSVDVDENDCEVVILHLTDWLFTDEQWGNEYTALGPF
jgi:enhancer of polycomb-like protein